MLLWLSILILYKYIQKELRKMIKSLLMTLIMMGLGFLFEKKILARLKQKTIFALISIVMKTDFSNYVSDQEFENLMDLLLVIDENKSHYVYIKDFDRFMFHKTKNKNKKWFCRSCLQCFSSESVLIKHKENCLSINGKQSVKLEKGIIEFENYFKQIPVPFKIYADFECNLKSVKSYEGSYSKNIKITFLVVLLINFFVLMMNVKPIVVFRGENAAYEFIEATLKEYEYCKKVMKKHFNKNLVMSE